jgi:hypothetical protein
MSLLKNYLVGVCEFAADGTLKGTHHVSSTCQNNAEDAAAWGLNDTVADWGLEGGDGLHVLFLMSTPLGIDIVVEEYNEGVL